jgi:gamma-butyrobetaine dioxygenase
VLHLTNTLRYFENPPRFQALHCLRNRVEGGQSYFVDGFASAEKLEQTDKNRLRSHAMPFEYDNDGHYLQRSHVVLPPNFDELQSAMNWSPPFQGRPTGYKSVEAELGHYEALHALETNLNSPEARYAFTMKEGDLVLFDNRRVLHARTAFRDLTPEELEERGVSLIEGEPTRWLKGCYLDGDVIWDKLAAADPSIYREVEERFRLKRDAESADHE